METKAASTPPSGHVRHPQFHVVVVVEERFTATAWNVSSTTSRAARRSRRPCTYIAMHSDRLFCYWVATLYMHKYTRDRYNHCVGCSISCFSYSYPVQQSIVGSLVDISYSSGSDFGGSWCKQRHHARKELAPFLSLGRTYTLTGSNDHMICSRVCPRT